MARTEPRIAILGAGPIGLEAALYAATLKLPFSVYERGRVGEHLQQWGHVRLFSPFGLNSTSLGRDRLRTDNPGIKLPGEKDLLTGQEHRTAYLEPLAQNPLLFDQLQLGTSVLRIGRTGLLKSDLAGDPRRGAQPFRLLVRDTKGERFEEADIVLDCTGTYAKPRWLGDGGIPAIGEESSRTKIVYSLVDVLGERRADYVDRTTLVIGSGYSAATTVCDLATLAEKHAGTWVIWLAHGAKSTPLRRLVNDPLRERDQLAVRANSLATRGDGNVEFHPQTLVEAVEVGADNIFRVRGKTGGKPTTWEIDRVVANVGYSPDTALYRELQVEQCPTTLSPPRPSDGPALARNLEPNFYVLGAKSYGRNSAFLLHHGFDQVREVFTMIVGKPCNLYCPRLAGG